MLCPRDRKSSATALSTDAKASRIRSNGSSLPALMSASPKIKALRWTLVCETDLRWATYRNGVSVSFTRVQKQSFRIQAQALSPFVLEVHLIKTHRGVALTISFSRTCRVIMSRQVLCAKLSRALTLSWWKAVCSYEPHQSGFYRSWPNRGRQTEWMMCFEHSSITFSRSETTPCQIRATNLCMKRRAIASSSIGQL